jgi:PAS domain S-box-containing protein
VTTEQDVEEAYRSLRAFQRSNTVGAILLCALIIGAAVAIARGRRRMIAANAELAQEEARFRHLLEAAPDGMLIADRAGTIVLVNEMVEQMFGYKREELVGREIACLLPERFQAGHAAMVSSFFDQMVSRPMGTGRDLAGRTRDGHEFPVEVSLSPQVSETGTVVLASIRDISERADRERKERALQRFREDIWALDTTSEVRDVLLRLERTLNEIGVRHLVCGVNVVDESGDRPTAVAHNLMRGEDWIVEDMMPESAQRVADRMRVKSVDYRPDLEEDDPYGERSHEGKHQSLRRCILDIPFASGTLAFNSEDPHAFDEYLPALEEISTVVSEGFLRLNDLRQLRERTEAAETANKEATLLHRSSEAAAASNSLDEVLQTCLDMVCELTGWPIGHAYMPDDDTGLLKSTTIWHLADTDMHAEFRRVTEETMFASGIGLPGRIWESGRPVSIVNVQDDANFPRNYLCEQLHVKGAIGFPILVGGTIIAVLEFFSEQEISADDEALLPTLRAVGEQVGRVIERQQAQESLRGAAEEARRANESKSQFLANMSHEIRTPMNAILGFSDILGEAVTDPQHRRYLESIQSSGKSLLSLINDILDLSRVEAGKLNLEYAAFNAPALFEEMKTMFEKQTEEKGIQFLVEIDEGLPTALVLDEVRLRQILINMVGNAVKFTERGYVKVSAHNLWRLRAAGGSKQLGVRRHRTWARDHTSADRGHER